jgi:DNA-binding FadR family transcriptional regulator
VAESQRLYERIAQELAAAIRRGEYQVGGRLPSERDLAQAFAVSRPTIREAVIALELDGLVEVRTGTGVFVKSAEPPEGVSGIHDIGPFELLEARRAIEGEVCAMAALRISDAQLKALGELVIEMRNENDNDVVRSENADRRFHELIALATENSALIAAVGSLWDARDRSPQNRAMSAKVRATGIKPRIDEHLVILKALKRRDADAARDAMRDHLTAVMEATFEATETEELEKARAQIAERRKRFERAR